MESTFIVLMLNYDNNNTFHHLKYTGLELHTACSVSVIKLYEILMNREDRQYEMHREKVKGRIKHVLEERKQHTTCFIFHQSHPPSLILFKSQINAKVSIKIILKLLFTLGASL